MSDTSTVVVSSEIASKLFLAYVGLSPVRRAVVDESVKVDKVSRSQATFNEIISSRIELYAKRGEAQQTEIMQSALNVLVARGISTDDARKALGLGE